MLENTVCPLQKSKNRNHVGMVHGYFHLFRVLHGSARCSSGSTATAKINDQSRLTVVHYVIRSPLFQYHVLNTNNAKYAHFNLLIELTDVTSYTQLTL